MPSGPCGPRKGVWNLSSEGPLTGSDGKQVKGLACGTLRKDECLPGQLYLGLRLTTLTDL